LIFEVESQHLIDESLSIGTLWDKMQRSEEQKRRKHIRQKGHQTSSELVMVMWLCTAQCR
jgi:hypothetical protein